MQSCYFCLNNSATLNIYINPKIFDSIINSLIQTDEMRSSMLYKKLVNELKKCIIPPHVLHSYYTLVLVSCSSMTYVLFCYYNI